MGYYARCVPAVFDEIDSFYPPDALYKVNKAIPEAKGK
jgi:hypothetical protein